MNSKAGKILSVISGLLASVCLYFGPAVLLLVPRGRHEPYLDWPTVFYGISPTILGVILIVLAGWLWGRGGPTAIGTRIRRAFNLAVGGVVLFWIVLIVIAHLEGRIP
jgi:hypothetical protein